MSDDASKLGVVMCGLVVNTGPLHRDWRRCACGEALTLPQMARGLYRCHFCLAEPPAYRVPPPECETCGDTGMVRWNGDDPIDCPDCEDS